MRFLLITLLLSAGTSAGFAQLDTARRAPTAPSTAPVPIPGVDSPISGPGTLLQSTPNPNAQPQRKQGRRNRRTSPPSDPRAFGVAVPLPESRKDTLRQPR